MATRRIEPSQIGVTLPYSRPVISGALAYSLRNTNGLPLELTIDRVCSSGGEISWVNYVDAAIKDGKTAKQAYKQIEAGVRDSFQPREWKLAVMERMDLVMKVRT